MKKIIKLLSFIFVLTLFILPTKVLAATHYLYSDYISNFSSADRSKAYYLGFGNTYTFSKLYIHRIDDGGNLYLGYCLDDGLSSTSGGSGTITDSDSSSLKNKAGGTLASWQVSLLKNIMAAGYQKSGDISSLKNASSSVKDNILATQILVWEVMDGVRSDYSTSNYNSQSPNTYDFVKTDSSLKTAYETILSDASKLAGNSKPASFGKTYVLHWNDGSKKYTSDSISIGHYSVDKYDNKLTVKTSNNAITVSTTSKISSPVDVNFKFVKGNTLSTSNKLRWFTFTQSSGAQKLLVGYYQGAATGKLSVKTESGSFKITKKDATTKKNLKGAVFSLYKCSSQSSCESSPVKTIDMKNKEISDAVTIDKSGLYLIKETTVPFGYEKINDFYIKFTIDDNGKVSAAIDGSVKNVTKKSASGSEVLNIIISDEEKSFNIKKIDGNNNKTEIKGATFRIKKTDGTVIKFIKDADGKYRYDAAGTVTNLVSTNKSVYAVSLLPVGEYILEETAVPYPYVIPSKQIEKETKFKIDKTDYLQNYNYTTNKYVKSSDVTITAKNFKTRVTIIKTGLKSAPIKGVTFELYNSNKTAQIPVKVENNEYVYNKGGSPIQLVTNASGKIVINYLPEGKYYLKETSTPADSGLAIDPNNQWTQIDIYVNRTSATPYNYKKEVRNAKGSFCFYKIDEDGNYLDSGKFILQMYNEKTSKYEDKALVFNETDKTYSIDTTNKSDIYTFSPISEGQTCFADVDVKGKYRVVEIEAPEGFVLPKVSETQAEIVINEYGYATGDAVIINKRIKVGEGAEAQAELIINIQTGQNKIHYIAIICGVIAIIIGLLVIKKKIDKK